MTALETERTFIIAEAGVNHNGSLERAKTMVEVAASCGCDAIKFQAFHADKLVTLNAPKSEYQIETTGRVESQFEMLRNLELKQDDYRELLEIARNEGIDFICTPFDQESASMLVSIGVKILKISSGDLNNKPFLVNIAKLRVPVILSTGMSYLFEVQETVSLFNEVWRSDPPDGVFPPLTLMHCLTQYPAPVDEVNLRAISALRDELNLPVGYSDHTSEYEVSYAAVAIGACMIEKHFTMDRSLPGPDHRASLEPDDLKTMVTAIRNIETALGNGIKEPAASELKNREIARRSIVASKYIAQGELYSEDNITTKRPGTGINPMRWDEVVGKKANRNYRKDELIQWYSTT